MINLNFVLHHKTGEIKTLSLPMAFRAFFFAVALFMTIAMVADKSTTGSDLGPLIIITICLLSGCYYESWIFNRESNSIEQRFGLIFLFRRKEMGMDDVESLRLSRFVKGSRQRLSSEKKKFFQTEFVKLSLVTRDGKIHDIETLHGRHQEKLEQKAQTLAQFCDTTLTSEDD